MGFSLDDFHGLLGVEITESVEHRSKSDGLGKRGFLDPSNLDQSSSGIEYRSDFFDAFSDEDFINFIKFDLVTHQCSLLFKGEKEARIVGQTLPLDIYRVRLGQPVIQTLMPCPPFQKHHQTKIVSAVAHDVKNLFEDLLRRLGAVEDFPLPRIIMSHSLEVPKVPPTNVL